MKSLIDQFFSKKRDDNNPGEVVYTNERPENQEELKIKAVVEGLVQGVGFRYSTYYVAKDLNITGFVKNRTDGTVYVEAVAEIIAMEQFIRELAKGPSFSSKVNKVTIEYDNSITDYTTFSQDR